MQCRLKELLLSRSLKEDRPCSEDKRPAFFLKMTKNMGSLFLLVSVLAMLLATGQCKDSKGKCRENMEWKDCFPSCPKTCEDVTNMGSKKFCPTVCKPPGCSCKEGYVLNGDRCVPEETCPCPPHAHYDKCGTKCPLTCDNHRNPPAACTRDCEMGCHCDKDYVRYGESGRCVLRKDCTYKG